jgi:hypothetical protein
LALELNAANITNAAAIIPNDINRIQLCIIVLPAGSIGPVHPTSRIHSNIPCWMPPKRFTLPGEALLQGQGRVPGIH